MNFKERCGSDVDEKKRDKKEGTRVGKDMKILHLPKMERGLLFFRNKKSLHTLHTHRHTNSIRNLTVR